MEKYQAEERGQRCIPRRESRGDANKGHGAGGLKKDAKRHHAGLSALAPVLKTAPHIGVTIPI